MQLIDQMKDLNRTLNNVDHGIRLTNVDETNYRRHRVAEMMKHAANNYLHLITDIVKMDI